MKRSPLRSMSRRRRRELHLRRAIVEQVAERDETCQAAAKLPQIACRGPLDVHELAPRSVDPHGWLIPERTILVCRRHHEYIDANPLGAREVGLHRFSWEVVE